MKCLACWEEIDETTKICPHCGADQKQVREFLEIAILRKIGEQNDEGEIVSLLKKLGLTTKLKKAISQLPQSEQVYATSSNQISATQTGYYQPTRPDWLEVLVTKKQEVETEAKVLEDGIISPEEKEVPMIVCPFCGEKVPDLDYCNNCGERLNIICPNCGRKNKVNSNFCKYCGFSLKKSS